MVDLNDRDRLSCYLDGELETAERVRFESRLRREPRLAEALSAMREQDRNIRLALQAGPESHVLATLRARLDPVPRLVPAAPSAAEEPVPARGFGDPAGVAAVRRWQPAALAASLAALALMVAAVAPWTRDGGRDSGDGLLLSAAQLGAVLDTAPSSASEWYALPDDGFLRPVLTFPSHQGSWCREFLLSRGDGDWRGVACREAGQWSAQVLGRETFLNPGAAAYRPAGAQDSGKVAAFIAQNAADIALSQGEETQLIARGWQAP